MIENNDNFRKHPSQHYKKIAGKNAREIYLKHKPHKCEICGYDKIVEVHHIKELKLFEPDYEKANSIENLIGLCPNHHKELHFGLISL
jgi:predicted restriction endonuclease